MLCLRIFYQRLACTKATIQAGRLAGVFQKWQAVFVKDATGRYEGREWVNRVLSERYSAGCSHFGFILGQNCSFLSFMPS